MGGVLATATEVPITVAGSGVAGVLPFASGDFNSNTIPDFTITIPAGQTSASADFMVGTFLTTASDSAYGDETIMVTATPPATLGLMPASASFKLTDNNEVTLVVIPASELILVQVNEGSRTVDIAMRIEVFDSRAPGTVHETKARQPLSIDYSISFSGTATEADVALPITGTLMIPKSNKTHTFMLDAVFDDAIDEGDEQFTITFSNPRLLTTGAAISGSSQVAIMIIDDDTTQVEFADTSVEVGEEAGSVAFTITLNPPNAFPLTVDYMTSDGTANAGSDYTATTGSITIPAMATSTTFSVPVLEDVLVEGSESFSVTLTGTDPGALGDDATATATITDNDTPPASSVCDRTPQVRDAIVDQIDGVTDCNQISAIHLATITSLNFSTQRYMTITELKAGDFAGLSELTNLNLALNNSLMMLPVGIFAGLSKLKTLLLGGNQLTTLPVGIFADLSELTTLGLGSNELTMLPAGIFAGLPKLANLFLQVNQFTTLPTGIFADLPTTAVVHLDAGVIVTPPADAFITTWRTTSANETITIPTTGTGYNYNVDCDANGIINFRGVTGDTTCTYATAGTHTVVITGDFPRIYFNGEGDNTKIMSVTQWGNQRWASMESAFRGTSNLQITATDQPDLSAVTSMRGMFRHSTVFNSDIRGWDVSNVESMAAMFLGARSFNQDIGGWTVSSVVNMSFMFASATAFDQNLGDWDVSLVTNFTAMFGSFISNSNLDVTLSTENYEKLLIGWAKRDLQNGKTLNVGATEYCSAEAITARAAIIASDGWTISDGGRCHHIVITSHGGSATAEISIPENQRSITTISGMSSKGANIRYTLGGANFGSFNIDASTGELEFTAANGVDFETPRGIANTNDYAAVVTITSVSGEQAVTARQSINITITDVNEAPSFDSGNRPAETVAEDADYEFIPIASDPEGDSLIFIIIRKPSWAEFSTITGKLSGTPGNADVGVTRNIMIFVTNFMVSGEVFSTVPLSFDLTVTNVNDAPTISGMPPTMVDEDTPYSFMPGGGDEDAGDPVVYSLSNNPAWLSVNPATGELSGTPTNADVGTTTGIVLSISGGELSASLPAFDLTVININDPPKITTGGINNPTVRIQLNENIQSVVTITATDEDGDTLNYSISSDASFDTALFDINQHGELIFKTEYIPDFEIPRELTGNPNPATDNLYIIQIKVTDPAGLSDTKTVRVTIRDVNPEPPTDISLSSTEVTNTHVPGSVIGILSKTGGITYASTTFRLVETNLNQIGSRNSSSRDNALFEIDGTKLKIRGNPNTDSRSIYLITIDVNDGIGFFTKAFVFVSVNNTAPEFVSLGEAECGDRVTAPEVPNIAFLHYQCVISRPENSQFIATIPATDAEGDELTFRVAGHQDMDGNQNDVELFEINQRGELSFKTESIADYERPRDKLFNIISRESVRNDYYVLLGIQDNRGGKGNIMGITVKITDTDPEPPAVIALSTTTVTYNAPAGTMIGTLSKTGGIANNITTFTLADGDDDTDNALFEIDGTELKIKATPASNRIDYDIRIGVSNGAGIFSTPFTITLTGVTAPRITSGGGATFANYDVNENTQSVATIKADDADGDAFTYSLLDKENFDTALFAINQRGELTFKPQHIPDFENPEDLAMDHIYFTTVRVTDTRGLYGEQLVIVRISNVNEAPTIAGIPPTTVAQGREYTFTPISYGEDADTTLEYTITNTPTWATFDTASGALIGTPTNADVGITEDIVISVTDNIAAAVSLPAFSITVTNVNDAPTISGTTAFTIAENAGNGAMVGTITGADIDAGTVLAYFITAGNSSNAFTIDPDTGEITVNGDNKLDHETTPSYSLTVTVGDGSLGAEVMVTITVTDIDETPTFTISGLVDAEIQENTPYTSATPTTAGDTPVGTLAWTLSGDDAADFSIDATSGVVSMVARNFEAPEDTGADNVYSATVTVTDSDNNADTQDIAITVTDVDESATFTISGLVDAEIQENTPYTSDTPSTAGDTPVGTLAWTLSGDDAADFSIDATSGVVSMVARNFEAPEDTEYQQCLLRRLSPSPIAITMPIPKTLKSRSRI